MEKLVILGTGPAGLTAAIYSARANLMPVVIEGPQPGGQLTTTTDIENYPGFPEGIGGFDLIELMKKQATRFGARFISAGVVEASLTPRNHQVVLDSGEQIQTLALIIATGATARYLGLPSEAALKGHGVSGCATCDGAFYRKVPVAVVGGGDTAMEEALFLTRFASKVYVIHRRDQFRASKIMAGRVMAHPQIEVVWDSVVEEVLDPAQGKVTGVRVKNVKTGQLREIPVQAMFAAIGHQPNVAPFKGQLELDERGYLKTERTRTRIEGVFAAGDVQDAAYRQAVTAAGSGCMAALEAERYLESVGA